MNNFQRVGSLSNSHIGRSFEEKAFQFYQKKNIELQKSFQLPIGVTKNKKLHCFDLGCKKNKIIIECKSHKWTAGGNVPSAKLTVWNEAMYYFHLAPSAYRKVFFVLKDFNPKRNETLAEYYIHTYRHLIPDNVEILEYNEHNKRGRVLNIN